MVLLAKKPCNHYQFHANQINSSAGYMHRPKHLTQFISYLMSKHLTAGLCTGDGVELVRLHTDGFVGHEILARINGWD